MKIHRQNNIIIDIYASNVFFYSGVKKIQYYDDILSMIRLSVATLLWVNEKKLLWSNCKLRARVMKVFLANNKLWIESIFFLSCIILPRMLRKEKKNVYQKTYILNLSNEVLLNIVLFRRPNLRFITIFFTNRITETKSLRFKHNGIYTIH